MSNVPSYCLLVPAAVHSSMRHGDVDKRVLLNDAVVACA